MKMRKSSAGKRVGVIMGGSSSERDVSLRSGAEVAAALEARGHDVVRFVLGESFGAEVAETFARARIDVAFLALHGRHGEDGCVQGLLELAQIPYTGSSVLASALAMDKVKAKELFRLHNVPTPPYYAIEASYAPADIEAIHGSFGFPVIVKPRGEGGSLGVSKASSLPELCRAIEIALSYDDVAIVERFIVGAEINIGILDGRVLGAIEVVPATFGVDDAAEVTPALAEHVLPASLPTARYRNVLNLAGRAAKALGCTGAVRVDMLVTSGENEYVLEVNTLPGLTAQSLLPRIAEGAGYAFERLCEAILDGARLHQPPRRSRAMRSGSLGGEVTVPFRRAHDEAFVLKSVG
jgi:D-alanine-D-alanine ligase